MSIRDGIDEIVALLREAELDHTLWPVASALIDETCGLRGNDLLLGRFLGQGGLDLRLRWLFLRGEPHAELEREYLDYMPIDERLAPACGLPRNELVHTNGLLSDGVRRTSVTYNEYLVPNAGENCLNVVMPANRDLQIAWSLVGPGGGHPGDWSSEQVDAIRQLLPHVRQFVRVRHALMEARGDGLKTTGLLDTGSIGMLLLDREGRIVEANDRARHLLAGNDGLTVHEGRLTAVSPEQATDIARLLEAACCRHCGGSMPIARPSLEPLVMYATPVGATGPLPFEKLCAARVLLAEPFSTPPVNPRRVAAALGLTRRQGQIVAALVAGGTAVSIAEQTRRTEATVRWHVREVLNRLGLSRQADLVRVVLSTPGIFEEDA